METLNQTQTNQKPKKKKKTVLIILIIIACLIAATAAGAAIYLKNCQKAAEEQISLLLENNKTVYFLAVDYSDEESEGTEYNLYTFDFNGENDIIQKEYCISYIDDKADYKSFSDLETEYSYYFKTDLRGNVLLTSGDGGYIDLKIETDEKSQITSLYDDVDFYLSVAESKYVNDLKQYLAHKKQYENIDNIANAFLNEGYSGYSTTWKEVLDKTFKYYDFIVDISDEYKDGYLITISGEYSINPVDLPEMTQQGSMVIAVNNDLTEAKLISGSNVKQACDLYVSLGTNWYLEDFYGY